MHQCAPYVFLRVPICVYFFFTLGNPGASDHAPGGGAVGGRPHVHRRLPADLQDLSVKSHGGRQETAGVVQGGQSPGHGEGFLYLYCCCEDILFSPPPLKGCLMVPWLRWDLASSLGFGAKGQGMDYVNEGPYKKRKTDMCGQLILEVSGMVIQSVKECTNLYLHHRLNIKMCRASPLLPLSRNMLDWTRDQSSACISNSLYLTKTTHILARPWEFMCCAVRMPINISSASSAVLEPGGDSFMPDTPIVHNRFNLRLVLYRQ